MRAHSKSLITILRPLEKAGHWYGIEVGVWRGLNAVELLKAFPTLTLYLVDDWNDENMTPKGEKFGAMNARTEAHENLQHQKHRTAWLEYPSTYAASLISKSSKMSFVFIDAGHDYESVKKDLDAWEPNVKEGGIIAGHDYGGGWPGVKQAVDERYGDRVQIGSVKSRVWWVQL